MDPREPCSALFGQVTQQYLMIRVEHERARRNGNTAIFAFLSVAITAPPMAPTFGLPMMSPGEVLQCVQLRIGIENHMAAVGAIASVRSALGNKLLPPETHTPVPAKPGGGRNRNLIQEQCS